ncbi:MAG: 2,3-bisphosphoglycerate-independent phosphoglycerate mutase [Armatimonadetes bacterium]|nr:2,3-bisphosphoglycerate-independent phosphoglycerate mutase [Armatimonadota bacterium]
MADTSKAVLLICDGMGDRPCPELGGKTPLEAARTPHMDKAAAMGECGILDVVRPGIRVGSDTGHLSILGYDAYAVYPGRGPFEALGIGLDVQRGDVAFRCNFSTVDDHLVVLDRRAGRITEGTEDLAQAIDGMQIEDVTVLFKESVAHRAALVLRGPGLGAGVSDTDPHHEGEKVWEAHSLDPADEIGVKTARILNAFVRKSYEALKAHPVNRKRTAQGLHPANIVLPRGVGMAPNLEDFGKLHGLKGVCIVEVGLIKGIGKYVGMDVIDVAGSTGGLDSDVMAIGRAVTDALKDYNFILCNVKGPDIAGHDGSARAKVEIIEKIDAMVGFLMENIGPETYLVITADHSTPVSVKDHSGDPVPIVFCGPGVRTDDCIAFGERSAARGGLHRIRGVDIISILTNLLGVQEKFGA